MNTPQSSLFNLRLFFLAACSSILLFSCGSIHKTASSKKQSKPGQGPRFLDGISVNPGDRVSSNNSSYGYIEKAPVKRKKESEGQRNLSLNEQTLTRKYASLLGVKPKELINIDLFEEVDDWYGTPYSYGGNSKHGIDCSAFSRTLLSDVFNLSIPRTAQDQYEYCKHIKKNQLKQGDLVFFHTSGGSRITHVGIYLDNGKFVHASTSSGVMISDLDDYYWKRTYRASGRIPDKDLTSSN